MSCDSLSKLNFSKIKINLSKLFNFLGKILANGDKKGHYMKILPIILSHLKYTKITQVFSKLYALSM